MHDMLHATDAAADDDDDDDDYDHDKQNVNK